MADHIRDMLRRTFADEPVTVAVPLAELAAMERTLIDLLADTGDLVAPQRPVLAHHQLLALLTRVQRLMP